MMVKAASVEALRSGVLGQHSGQKWGSRTGLWAELSICLGVGEAVD